MLITFTTEYGNLVIRAEDLRRLEDKPGYDTTEPDRAHTAVCWLEHTEMHFAVVHGTAAENHARIIRQEAEIIRAYEAAQRQTNGEQPRLTRGNKVRARQ
jgi:hypothetical protein